MAICVQCEGQLKKSRNGKPHEKLTEMNELRVFIGSNDRGFEEQDYECLDCKSRFTRSTDKNDFPWTLWNG